MSTVKFKALDGLNFDNRFTRELPADPDTTNTRRQVHGACYSRVRPTPVAEPRLVAYSREVAEELDLTHKDCISPEFREVFSGNRLLEGMDPYAICYGGHQFGQWAGQLGDGRAINLGETVSRRGDRRTLQLKGAGPTPYSRTADGLAVLRSSVREFPVQRGDASPRSADDSGSQPCDHWRSRGPGHVLRWPPQRRAGSCRLSRRPVVFPFRQL